MSEWFSNFLDVPPSLAGQAWQISLQRSPPTWLSALGLLFIITLAWRSYTGLRGARLARGFLSFIRIITLTCITLLLLGPMIEWPRERVEQDWVHVMMDRSASMQVKDEHTANGQRCTRDERIRSMLQDPIWTSLRSEHQVDFFAMSAGAVSFSDTLHPPEATGNRTLIASALGQVMRQANNRPTSAIVLVSDGRTQDTIDAATLRRFKMQSTPVFVVPLGDPAGVADRAIVEVEFPQRAFPKDRVPVQITVSSGDASPVRIALRDRATGKVIDERTEKPGDDHRIRITLTGENSDPGEVDWQVVLLPEGQDADASNDIREVSVTFMDRPLRVLYVDGWPRWEYRYLKNILLREEGMQSSVMLLSADRDFAQEGTAPLLRLPTTAEELAPFDVIVIGDVPGSFLDDAKQRLIREHIAKRGAGFLWIGGERSTPSSWAGTPLEDLLPFRASMDVQRWDEPVSMQPTALAHRLGLLQLGDDEQPWPESLGTHGESWSQLEWAQRLDQTSLKPTVETWAIAHAAANTSTKKSETTAPLVVSMRFGAGTVAYVGTDETWRWRYGRGETLPERFWIQIIRHLARNGLRSEGSGPMLEVEPSSAAVDQPVRVVLDGSSGVEVDRVIVEARRVDGGEVIELPLLPEGNGRFATAWSAPREGNWTLRVTQPTVRGSGEAKLQVRSEEPERLDASPDHATLEQIAQATGGRVIQPSELASLIDLAPHRSVTIRQPIERPLWDRWPIYALLTTLLVIEWMGRRLLRLT